MLVRKPTREGKFLARHVCTACDESCDLGNLKFQSTSRWRKMKSNSLLFLTSNRFGGVRKEGKFWVLNKFYNCYRTHRSGLVWLKWQFWVDGTFFCHHWETMVTINWVCCRFFICLYDLNTVCFLSSWSWDVVETQILVRLCLPEYCR